MLNPNRYAAILRVRKQAEDRQAQAMVAIRNELQQAIRQRTDLELARRSALEHAGSSLQAKFDAGEIRGYYQFERHLAHLRDAKDAQIRELKQREAEQLARLEQVTKERRIAEKLHERRREQYRAHLRKEEQKMLDETGTMYTARSARHFGIPVDKGNES